MSSIIYLPLDERPCNLQYPTQLAHLAGLPLKVPPLNLLGDKKKPADCQGLNAWLTDQTDASDKLIVSIDMLVYGGIVPSRLHHLTKEECSARLNVLRELKEQHPGLSIYAFNLIMRTPSYNSDDEEPAYYNDHGIHIYRYSWLSDKREREQLTPEDQAEWESLQSVIPAEVLEEHLHRRSVNAYVNECGVRLVDEGILDVLVIPLDDNAEYGFTAAEQRKVLFLADELNVLDRVHIYPGADEIGCTLMARVFCETHQYRPELFLRYSSTRGPAIIPCLEDRSLHESIKSHVTAAGAVIGDSSSEADFVLMVNSPAAGQYDVADSSGPLRDRHRSYFSEVNLREFASVLDHYAAKGKMVALADVSTLNGSDQSLMRLLSKKGLLPRLAAYAGWNTSGNTLGTVIAHAIIESYYFQRPELDNAERRRRSREFLLERLVEDWGYQAIVRRNVLEQHLSELGANYFDVSMAYDQVVDLVETKLTAFIHTYLQDFGPERIALRNVRMPWRRMFEVGLQIEITG